MQRRQREYGEWRDSQTALREKIVSSGPASEKRAAIFDLDGTFVDTAEDLAAAMNHALADAGLAAVDPGAVRGLVGSGARAMLTRGFAIAAGRAASEGELDAGMDVFLDYYGAHIADRSQPFDGAVAFVESLREAGWAAAICTNKREKLARMLLSALGVDALFDTIVGADTTYAKKPDPAPVRLCLDSVGAASGVFFGDSDTDIRAAEAAEMPCYLASFGYGPLTLRGRATRLFDSYDDAARLFREEGLA